MVRSIALPLKKWHMCSLWGASVVMHIWLKRWAFSCIQSFWTIMPFRINDGLTNGRWEQGHTLPPALLWFPLPRPLEPALWVALREWAKYDFMLLDIHSRTLSLSLSLPLSLGAFIATGHHNISSYQLSFGVLRIPTLWVLEKSEGQPSDCLLCLRFELCLWVLLLSRWYFT